MNGIVNIYYQIKRYNGDFYRCYYFNSSWIPFIDIPFAVYPLPSNQLFELSNISDITKIPLNKIKLIKKFW